MNEQISSGKVILPGTPASVSTTALSQLSALNVDVRLSLKVESSAPLGSATELTLSDGTKLSCDVYLPTIGLVPNSQFIPDTLLDRNGYVVVDENLNVQGTKDVWAVGDVSNVQRPQYVNTDKQASHVVKNICLALTDKPLVKYGGVGGGAGELFPFLSFVL